METTNKKKSRKWQQKAACNVHCQKISRSSCFKKYPSLLQHKWKKNIFPLTSFMGLYFLKRWLSASDWAIPRCMEALEWSSATAQRVWACKKLMPVAAIFLSRHISWKLFRRKHLFIHIPCESPVINRDTSPLSINQSKIVTYHKGVWLVGWLVGGQAIFLPAAHQNVNTTKQKITTNQGGGWWISLLNGQGEDVAPN